MEIKGLSQEKAYEIKEAIDSCHQNITVIVDDDKLTIKPTNWDEVMRGIARMAELTDRMEKRKNEEFIREYRASHPEV